MRKHNNVLETKGIRRDGTIFVADLSISEVQIEGGSVFTVFVRDITDRKLAEEASAKSDAMSKQLAAVVESSDDAIISEDLNGVILSWNKGAEAIFGYTAEEIIGNQMVVLFPPERLHEEDEILTRLRRGERIDHFETVRLRKKGEKIDVSVTVSPIRNSNGEVTGASQFARDITPRKRSEAILVERRSLTELMAQIGVALTRVGALREALQGCVDAIVQHLDAAFARIWTISSSGDAMELQASGGFYARIDAAHSRVPVGRFEIGLIAKERKPHVTNQVVGDPRVGDQEWAEREGMVSFAGYPLIIDDRIVGVMALFARHPLSESTLKTLATVADGIAVAIERKFSEA
ncbi:MAG: PAS domain S-box protein, partial [Planctomycetes bacterium]|nr:PAS domain S-box protein [Planctomycetota bacterium]